MSIENKLGIHASPTCTMSFGDEGRCTGYLVGEENAGMRAMFTMMNHARINVGLEGVAIGERAYQAALTYARERVQGRRIIEFADVRRMLMTMKATVEAIRALAYLNAAAVDRGHAGDEHAQALADLLTPITKAYATDMGVEVASIGIQIHGGMGFVEETGAAQHLRDARIAPIYEGTNGIQALDLVNRKLPQGRWRALVDEMQEFCTGLDGDLEMLGEALSSAVQLLGNVSLILSDPEGMSAEDRAAGATPFLRLFGIVLGAYLLVRQAASAQERQAEKHSPDQDFLKAKIATASFFCQQILPQVYSLSGPATGGAVTLFAIPEYAL